MEFFKGSLPLPPSVNQAYKVYEIHGKHRICPSPELAKFKQDAPTILFASVVDWEVVRSIQEAKQPLPVACSIHFYFETLWKSDLDGRGKYVVDACCSYLNINDNRITQMNLEKSADRSNPRVEIILAIIR